MRTVVAVVSLLAVGCADPAPPTPQYLTVTDDNGEVVVAAPDYEMHFSPVDTRLPTSLVINRAEEALGAEACPTESLVGTSLFPVAVASGGVKGASDLFVEMAGPAIARVRVTYKVPYCGVQELDGESTFTFFPSGRIVRHDKASPSTAPFQAIPTCGCGNGSQGNMYFSSFWRFKTTTMVNPDGSSIATDAPAARGCVVGTNYTIAFAWADGMTRARREASTVSTTYDFLANLVQLPVTERQVTSAIQVRGDVVTPCATIQQELTDVQLTVDNMLVHTDENGVYVDPTPHVNTFDILARDGTVPGFGIVLHLPGSAHARVSQPEGTYAVQRYPGADDTFLFWFERGLGQNDRITIEPY